MFIYIKYAALIHILHYVFYFISTYSMLVFFYFSYIKDYEMNIVVFILPPYVSVERND